MAMSFASALKVAAAALHGSVLFCLAITFVIDLWEESAAHLQQDADPARQARSSTTYCDADRLKHAALTLVVAPSLFTLSIGAAIVTSSLRHPNPLLQPVVVRQHARALSTALILAAMDEGMLALLPWMSTAWSGFPTCCLLLCVVLTALVRQVPMIILTTLRLKCGIGGQVERRRELALLVLLITKLVQELAERGLLAAGLQRLEHLPSVRCHTAVTKQSCCDRKVDSSNHVWLSPSKTHTTVNVTKLN